MPQELDSTNRSKILGDAHGYVHREYQGNSTNLHRFKTSVALFEPHLQLQ